MEIEPLKSETSPSKDKSSPEGSLLSYDLPLLIDTMKQSYTWANGELNALILLRNNDKKIVLTAIHAGTEIMSFQSDDSVTVQIIEGRLMFYIRKDTIILQKGQLMTIDKNINYRMKSQEETVFLLTISNTGSKHTIN